MNSKMKLDKNGNPLQNEYLSIMFIDGGTDMTKYSFEAELKVYYTIWNKKQILLEHSYGDYEIIKKKLLGCMKLRMENCIIIEKIWWKVMIILKYQKYLCLKLKTMI